VIGAASTRRPANARWGKSDYLVAEADESDGSFLTLTPTAAIVTNVDPEHLRSLHHYDNVKKAFTDFSATASRSTA